MFNPNQVIRIAIMETLRRVFIGIGFLTVVLATAFSVGKCTNTFINIYNDCDGRFEACVK